MGDVIDIGVLRTTLWECRHWMKGDQYNGCIVRVANSCVFKEPVFNYTGDFHRFHDPSARPVAGPGRERSEERAGREGKGR
jgi:small-conductance mechanosensitive channel